MVKRVNMGNHLKSVTLLHDKYPTNEQYPFSLQVLKTTERITFKKPVTIFAGENGTGKSTLLEAIAKACGIHIWCREDGVRVTRNRYEKMLHHCLDIEWAESSVPGSFFGSEVFRDFKGILDEWAAADPAQLGYFGGQSLMTQSHGQSMMSYFLARYGRRGLYFLDEPETALSPKSQLELMEIITENSLDGHAQFIMVTHSPILLACENADIISFDYVPVRKIGYKDTDHYRVYREFLLEKE